MFEKQMEKVIRTAMELIEVELRRAMKGHAHPMNSSHEAYGVIHEEFVIEFGAAMHKNDTAAQQHEMVQVGAMAARALVDLYL